MLARLKQLLLLSTVLLTGCAALVQKPEVSLKRTTLLRLDTAGADLEFYLGVTNPNSFAVSLLGYTYDLQVMTLPLTEGGKLESVSFAAGKETDLRLPVRIRFADLMEVLKRRPDPDRIPYRLKANLQLQTMLGEMNVPLENSGEFAVPEKYRPGFYLNRLRDSLRPVSP